MLCIGMWAQTVTLTFTGQDAADNWVQLDRVSVTNLTKGWQETIYWPDTILTMQNSTDIIDYANNGGLVLSQNNPNPFNGTTDVNLTVADAGMVTLEITDANGRNVGMHRVRLQSSTHQFCVTLSAAGTYMMTVRQNGKSSSIKMVNNGGGGKNAIEKIGIYERTNVMKSGEETKGNVVHPWAYGDDLTIIGYAIICGTECTKQFSRQLLYDETTTINFSESITTPTVAASSVSNITISSASVSSSVSGECGVTSRGFCYGTSSNPTISGQHTTNGSGTGSFTGTLNGLTAGTTYYVRAYATNAVGTAYGSQTSFTALALPTVTTNIISNITNNTATGGGNVTSQGTDSVTSRGVCWGISHNPTISSSHTTDGSGIGSFTSNITGWTQQGITFFVRAYATNSVGTSYGNEVIFSTAAPTVITSEVTNIAATTATCGGEVTVATGAATVTARGVCWSTSHNPTISNIHTTNGSGTGSFTSNITGLTQGITYYVRAYATNSVGTSYGNEVSFAIPGTNDAQPCPGTPTLTDIDGNVYNTVVIGNQCWMKENLRTKKYADGTAISQGSNYSTTVAYWYYSGNDSSNFSTYGLLYNWKALMGNSEPSSANPSGVQGICPTGWHVPSDAEWTQLTDYVSSQSQYVCGSNNEFIAKALASTATESSTTTGWWNSTNTCTVGNMPANNNATGFSALPAGNIYCNGAFGASAHFWSATTSKRSLKYDQVRVDRTGGFEECALSVRCLRDEGVTSASLPTVTTSSVTDITSSTATSGCNVTSDGGTTVIACGVCWRLLHNPTIANSHTTDGSGMGSFTSSLTGLTAGTTYYVRAYATNSAGTAYGNEVSFTTSSLQLPMVITSEVTNIAATTATSGGNVTSDGGANVTSRGVCWSTSHDPTISGSHTTNGTGMSSFTCSLTGLSSGTTYFVRAYATNSAGTAYGDEVIFTTLLNDDYGQPCPGTPTLIDVDGNVYNTVKIGSQCWMKENLRTTRYANFTEIPLGNTISFDDPYRYIPNNDESNVLSYGYLYNWAAVMQGASSSSSNPSGGQGICPTGWHVPSDAEWTQLTDYVSSQSQYVCSNTNIYIAKALASTTGWNSNNTTCAIGNIPSDNNVTGFGAMPAGLCSYQSSGTVSSFYGSYADFWSATESSGRTAQDLCLSWNYATVMRDTSDKRSGYSVRCVRD